MKILDIAAAQVGTVSAANNDTPYSAWYQANFPKAGNSFDGEDWCAMFASWCLHQAGVGLQFAWVPDGVNAFRAYGLLDAKPRPGDLVFYDWNHDGVGTHVGLVEFVAYNGTVQTIEGNTQQAGVTGVWRHLVGDGGDRGVADVIGYGHPFYP